MRANIAGFSAIAMWAILALASEGTRGIPPFQTAAIAFAIGTITGWLWYSREVPRTAGQKAPIYVIVTGGVGLFAYHALYFAAVKSAPIAQASLIAYLWPLLIVLGSAFLPGQRLQLVHIIGAVLGLTGTVLLVGGDGIAGFSAQYTAGYALALAAAFTWATYSLCARKFEHVASNAVIGYCGLATVLAGATSLIFETIIWDLLPRQWLSLVVLGVLPLGAAFFTWDMAMKHGDVQIVGVGSYATPLLSTLILIAFGAAAATWSLAIACVLITAGALIAALPSFRRKA